MAKSKSTESQTEKPALPDLPSTGAASETSEALSSAQSQSTAAAEVPWCGQWQAKGGGFDLAIECESRDVAVKVAMMYTGFQEAVFVFTKRKEKATSGVFYPEVSVDAEGKQQVAYERR